MMTHYHCTGRLRAFSKLENNPQRCVRSQAHVPRQKLVGFRCRCGVRYIRERKLRRLWRTAVTEARAIPGQLQRIADKLLRFRYSAFAAIVEISFRSQVLQVTLPRVR